MIFTRLLPNFGTKTLVYFYQKWQLRNILHIFDHRPRKSLTLLRQPIARTSTDQEEILKKIPSLGYSRKSAIKNTHIAKEM